MWKAAVHVIYFMRKMAVHIRKIREAIEREPGNPEYILTVWGEGYRFQGGGQ